MSSSSAQLASNLLELIRIHEIEQICVHNQEGNSHYFYQDAAWHFDAKIIQLGQSFYNTIALLNYQVIDNQLSLYF